MRSFIIIEVEHGEDTDSLEEFAGIVSDDAAYRFGKCSWTVVVDLPPYLTSVNVNAALEVRA